MSRAGVSFPIRHGAQVRCTLADNSVQPGWIGKVIAMRANQGVAQYLVKWRGKSGPVAVLLSSIEEVQ